MESVQILKIISLSIDVDAKYFLNFHAKFCDYDILHKKTCNMALKIAKEIKQTNTWS